MGHTNSTANLSLPQFIGTDKPTWLGDINGAFSAIDAYAGTNDAAVAAAASDASSAVSQAAAAVNTANTANTTAGNASTTANNAIGVANTANAIAGTVDAKVGLLANLNTTDRTSIVNAINETYDLVVGATTYTVIADGVKTYSDILSEMYAGANLSLINSKSVFDIDGSVYHLVYKNASSVYFAATSISGAGVMSTDLFTLDSTGVAKRKAEGDTLNDRSSLVPTVGSKFSIVY